MTLVFLKYTNFSTNKNNGEQSNNHCSLYWSFKILNQDDCFNINQFHSFLTILLSLCSVTRPNARLRYYACAFPCLNLPSNRRRGVARLSCCYMWHWSPEGVGYFYMSSIVWLQISGWILFQTSRIAESFETWLPFRQLWYLCNRCSPAAMTASIIWLANVSLAQAEESCCQWRLVYLNLQ